MIDKDFCYRSHYVIYFALSREDEKHKFEYDLMEKMGYGWFLEIIGKRFMHSFAMSAESLRNDNFEHVMFCAETEMSSCIQYFLKHRMKPECTSDRSDHRKERIFSYVLSRICHHCLIELRDLIYNLWIHERERLKRLIDEYVDGATKEDL